MKTDKTRQTDKGRKMTKLRVVLIWAVFIFSSALPALSEQACKNPIITDNLEEQKKFLDGSRNTIQQFLRDLVRADLSVMVSDDQYLNVCNSALFKSTVATQLFGEQFVDIVIDTPEYKLKSLRIFSYVLGEYGDLVFDLEARGLSRDPLMSDFMGIIKKISKISEDIIRDNTSFAILPHHPDHGKNPVYRTLLRKSTDLVISEFSLSGDDSLLETEYTISREQNAPHRFDTIVLPFRINERWLQFSERIEVDVANGDQGYLYLASERILVPFEVRRNVRQKDLQDSIAAYFNAFYQVLNKTPVVKGSAAGSFFTDESNDTEPTNEKDRCIQYLRPEDNDLFVYKRPETTQPLFLDISRTGNNFRVLSGPILAGFQDDLEKKVGRQIYHRGHRVLEWVEIEVADQTVFAVYSKSTLNAQSYVRFKEVTCDAE